MIAKIACSLALYAGVAVGQCPPKCVPPPRPARKAATPPVDKQAAIVTVKRGIERTKSYLEIRENSPTVLQSALFTLDLPKVSRALLPPGEEALDELEQKEISQLAQRLIAQEFVAISRGIQPANVKYAARIRQKEVFVEAVEETLLGDTNEYEFKMAPAKVAGRSAVWKIVDIKAREGSLIEKYRSELAAIQIHDGIYEVLERLRELTAQSIAQWAPRPDEACDMLCKRVGEIVGSSYRGFAEFRGERLGDSWRVNESLPGWEDCIIAPLQWGEEFQCTFKSPDRAKRKQAFEEVAAALAQNVPPWKVYVLNEQGNRLEITDKAAWVYLYDREGESGSEDAVVLKAGLAADPAADEDHHVGNALLARIESTVNSGETQRLTYTVTTFEEAKPWMNQKAGPRDMVVDSRIKGNLRLLAFSAPADLAGSKVLYLSPERAYVYLPAFGKTRRIKSDPMPEELLGLPNGLDLGTAGYQARLIASSALDYDLELTSLPGKLTTYSKIKMTVERNRDLPVKLVYYGADGNHARTEIRSGYSCKGKICSAGTRKFIDKTGKKITVTRTDWLTEETIPDSVFDPKRLDMAEEPR